MPEMICLKHTIGILDGDCEACFEQQEDGNHLFLKECQDDYLTTLVEAIELWERNDRLKKKWRVVFFAENPQPIHGLDGSE